MMQFNLPIHEDLKKHKNILILGIGGGFDVYCGLPIAFKLMSNGCKVTLANYSFTDLEQVRKKTSSVFHTEFLVENKDFISPMTYNPEGYLYEGMKKLYEGNMKVYSIGRQGVQPVLDSLKRIIELEKIDCIIAIDGGVDSIFHGNEEGCGTILEDSISITALDQIEIPKFLACIGMTTEIEEKVCNYSTFKLLGDYTLNEGLLGIVSLNKNMIEFQFMKDLCEYCWSREYHKKSHISSRIIPSVEGSFKSDMSHNFLQSLYFFFNFDIVASENVLKNRLLTTQTFTECISIIKQRNIKEPRKILTM